MTFQEAQTTFSTIITGIQPGMSSSQLMPSRRALSDFLNSLPEAAEFDAMRQTVMEFLPKLSSIITEAVVRDIQSRDGSFRNTAGLLTQVSNKAANDARRLTFEKPKLVLAALEESVTKLKKVHEAVEAKNFQEAASTIESLIALVEQVRGSVKTT